MNDHLRHHVWESEKALLYAAQNSVAAWTGIPFGLLSAAIKERDGAAGSTKAPAGSADYCRGVQWAHCATWADVKSRAVPEPYADNDDFAQGVAFVEAFVSTLLHLHEAWSQA